MGRARCRNFFGLFARLPPWRSPAPALHFLWISLRPNQTDPSPCGFPMPTMCELDCKQSQGCKRVACNVSPLPRYTLRSSRKMVSEEYKADSFSYISLCCLFIFASRPENGNTSQTSCRKHTTSQANSRSDKEREQWTMMAMLRLFNGQLMKYSVVKTAHGHGKQRTHQRRKKPSL